MGVLGGEAYSGGRCWRWEWWEVKLTVMVVLEEGVLGG